MYKHILIPTDGGDLAEKAVAHGLELARMLGAKVTILRVLTLPSCMVIEGVVIAYPAEEVRRQVREVVRQHFEVLEKKAKALGVDCTMESIECDLPWRGIVERAEKGGIDLIVMSSHGRKGMASLLIGSETHKVLTHSKVPMLVYR